MTLKFYPEFCWNREELETQPHFDLLFSLETVAYIQKNSQSNEAVHQLNFHLSQLQTQPTNREQPSI